MQHTQPKFQLSVPVLVSVAPLIVCNLVSAVAKSSCCPYLLCVAYMQHASHPVPVPMMQFLP